MSNLLNELNKYVPLTSVPFKSMELTHIYICQLETRL